MGPFAPIEAKLDRILAAFVYRENELDRMEAVYQDHQMTSQVKSLTGNLPGMLARINAAAAAAQDRLVKAADQLDSSVAKVNALGKEISDAAATIDATVGTASNGPPSK